MYLYTCLHDSRLHRILKHYFYTESTILSLILSAGTVYISCFTPSLLVIVPSVSASGEKYLNNINLLTITCARIKMIYGDLSSCSTSKCLFHGGTELQHSFSCFIWSCHLAGYTFSYGLCF